MYFHIGFFYVLSVLVTAIWFHTMDTLSIPPLFSSAFFPSFHSLSFGVLTVCDHL